MLPFTPIERIVESTLSGDWSGCTLLDYLERRYDYLSREEWARQITAGRLKVNGTEAEAALPVFSGDVVAFEARDLPEQEVSWEIRVLAESDDYIVVDKPPNLPCHPAGRFFNHTLWAWLKQLRGLEGIHFVTRLDRETSGALLVGKNPRFAARAAKLLHSDAAGGVKQYAVLVHGRVPVKEFLASGWLTSDRHSPVRKKRAFLPVTTPDTTDCIALPEDEEAEICQTEFTLRCYCRPPESGEEPTRFIPDESGEFSLLEARLRTGRTHQIRATLCSLGYPVVGDKLYGVDDRLYLKFIEDKLTDEDRRRLILPHQALHAQRLQIPPLGIDLTTPPPFAAL
ncbi:MAG: RluA family pseudouridine synthase [Victivallales bacterium]|nr:RluA family pseudouridine synthase [Victivallales bacterium]